MFLKFLLIFSLATSVSLKDLKDFEVNELIRLAEDITKVRPAQPSEDDIQIILVTRESMNEVTNTTELDNTKGTKVLIHGWLVDHEITWYKDVTSEYLNNNDLNIIQVDWETIARQPYTSSAKNTKFVGDYVGQFILDQNLSMDNLHLIGHSLGGHVAGFIGKKLKENGKKAKRISALDPAGPYFRESFINENHRLSNQDAEIVDVIHTDGGVYGYKKPIGTLDIYVNGGTRIQPGCLRNIKITSFGNFIETTFCSHLRSTEYFAESINSGKFTCKKCQFSLKRVKSTCISNESYVIGSDDITESTKGTCYVETNSKKPYLK